jgi:hypothetical protein
MSQKWSKDKKWINFMSFIGWEGQYDWNNYNPTKQAETIPLVEAWTRTNIQFIKDAEVKMCFKRFYWPPRDVEDVFSSHEYTRKTRAEYALSALYAKERANGR